MTTNFADVEQKTAHLIKADPYLAPYRATIRRRLQAVEETAVRLLSGGAQSLAELAAGHTYYGLHRRGDRWVFREWAPNAAAIFLIGDMSAWKVDAAFALQRINTNGDWELILPGESLQHGMHYRLHLEWPAGQGERIPAYARRVVQDPVTGIFSAQVWLPAEGYRWRHQPRRAPGPPLFIYEAHVGMAQEEGKVGSYREFTRKVLPRVAAAGYDTLQLMALQEHPYYASFGYQVSSFFAAASRFGTPEELKELIDTAHGHGLRVLMDLIHSHAVANVVEGLSHFDGTPYQYFHDGARGRHPAWDSRCFNYARPQVLHFLLSNCRYWVDEYRVDGFRFDGVTSMIYHHHGLEKAFTCYDDYFGSDVDEDALAYLALANRLLHELDPGLVTVAEDVSGLPGLAAPAEAGGIGFDYRFAMGVPDYWIRLTKEIPDERWPLEHLWHELTNRRPEEKTISYAESHDQALVGDQTLIYRLLGNAIYDHMEAADPHLTVARGMALHKLIRLITLATAGSGYLTFMGNEFGHPEWIDFPREGNQWSYHYARRQWHLADNPDLKYGRLACFDRAMIRMARQNNLFETRRPKLVRVHQEDKVLAFERSGLLFVFNFHPETSFTDYALPVGQAGDYRMILNTDDGSFGGHDRLVPGQSHTALAAPEAGGADRQVRLYLPSRCALVLAPVTATGAKARHFTQS
jgi:1,4-alpha-glucan branching enzyme